MKMMLFHYTKTRKRQAIKVAVNILIIPVLLYMFQKAGKDQPNFEDVYAVAEKAAIALAVVLTGILIWFLKSKERFELYVTENEFYSYHPVFKEWCFNVNPKEIASIEHNLNVGAGRMTNINVHLKDGRKCQISQNYAFSRKDLYAALQKINPDIDLPDNANTFRHEPTKETDEYLSNRFPVTTKIIKTVLNIFPNRNNPSNANDKPD